MHAVIWHAFEFPDYYGCNWSAFWDCFKDMYGEPIHIEIIGLEDQHRIKSTTSQGTLLRINIAKKGTPLGITRAACPIFICRFLFTALSKFQRSCSDIGFKGGAKVGMVGISHSGGDCVYGKIGRLQKL